MAENLTPLPFPKGKGNRKNPEFPGLGFYILVLVIAFFQGAIIEPVQLAVGLVDSRDAAAVNPDIRSVDETG